MSFVPASWDQPMLTGEFNAQGVTRVLEAIRRSIPRSGSTRPRPARCSARSARCRRPSMTPFYPRSPYGVSKVFGHYITVNYRESYGLFAVSGHPLQSRVAPPRPGVRDPQGDRRRGAHQARAGRLAAARQPRRATRLGLRGRLRAGDVADAPAGPARRLRRRHGRSSTRCGTGRDRVRARRPRLAAARRASIPRSCGRPRSTT